MKRLQLFLVLLLCSQIASAQSERQFLFEAAYSNQIVQDKGHSPLHYKGNGLYLGISTIKLKNDLRFSRGIGYGSNSISSGTGEGTNHDLNTAQRTNVIAHYGLLKQTSLEKFQLFWGAQLYGNLDYIAYNQKANNLIGYELSLSIDPAIYAEYALNNNIRFSFQGHLPILAYTIRPEAQGLFPLKDFDLDLAEILTGGSLVSINKYFNINTRTSAHFKLKKIPLKVFYDYSGGINFSRERKAYSTGKIGLQIPLIFKLKKQ